MSPRVGPRFSRANLLFGALVLVHALMSAWAWRAWMNGPFRGRAILDGGEVLQLAHLGPASRVDTKSPLYPWLLGLLLKRGLADPTVVWLLGAALSVAILVGLGALGARWGGERGRLIAGALYVVSGSPLAMLTQPLPTLLATLLLLGGVLGIARLADAPASPLRVALGAGACLAASLFALASLLPAALLVPCAPAARGRRLAVAAGAAAVMAAGLLLFGERSWPAGSGLNLRLGNSGTRSGTSDVRPGPAYDRLRLEPAFAAWDEGASHVDIDAFNRRALLSEVAAEPAGAAATLLRKLFLFWHRTEIVTDWDFRHGLRTLGPFPIMLLAYGLIAPLALAELIRRRGRPALLALPVAGVLLANVVFLTSARYRFPALPFLCVAAGLFLASRPRAPALLLAAALAVLLNVNLSGRALVLPGDGFAQEGRELLAEGREVEALVPLKQAADALRDPRALYDLALAHEKLAVRLKRKDLQVEAERLYLEALALDPLFPQPAENLMRLQIIDGRVGEALELGRRTIAINPYAGFARLNLAAALKAVGQEDEIRGLLVEGHRIAALCALAQNEVAGARGHAYELLVMGASDERLDRLIAAADRRAR